LIAQGDDPYSDPVATPREPRPEAATKPRSEPTTQSTPIHRRRSEQKRINKARYYLQSRPGAIQGQKGAPYTFGVICSVMKGFDLSPADTLIIIKEWNTSCQPPWSEKDLEQKIESADDSVDQQQRGYLIKDKQRFIRPKAESLWRSEPVFEEQFDIRQNNRLEEGADDEKKEQDYISLSNNFIPDP